MSGAVLTCFAPHLQCFEVGGVAWRVVHCHVATLQKVSFCKASATLCSFSSGSSCTLAPALKCHPMSHELNLLLPCASHGHPELQTLNKFVEQHSFEGGDFFLGTEYSYAEVAATPFFHRASIALPEYRGYSIETALQQNNLTRLQSWFKVHICLIHCMLILSSLEYLTSYQADCLQCSALLHDRLN